MLLTLLQSRVTAPAVIDARWLLRALPRTYALSSSRRFALRADLRLLHVEVLA